jgi:hypothetical protein
MDSSPTSEDRLEPLRRAVHGDDHSAGLARVLPLLQVGHRRELRTEPHWSKEELVRHPEPRELIRSMRKPGNLDVQGRPVYTLDERRSLTANIYENRVVRQVVDEVERRLAAEADERADELLRDLHAAVSRAPFLQEVESPRTVLEPTATLTQDPLYRAVVWIRRSLA